MRLRLGYRGLENNIEWNELYPKDKDKALKGFKMCDMFRIVFRKNLSSFEGGGMFNKNIGAINVNHV